MKGKYDKIANYNLSYENLLEAINEFEGFVTGVSHNDISELTLGDIGSLGKAIKQKDEIFENLKKLDPSNEDKVLEMFIKNISSRVLDRTSGGYFMYDMFDGEVVDKFFNILSDVGDAAKNLTAGAAKELISGPEGIGKYMHIFLPGAGFKNNTNNAFTTCSPKNTHMNDIITYYDINRLQSTARLNNSGVPVYDENGDPKEKWTTDFDENVLGSNLNRRYPEINRDRSPDKFGRPNLGAIVMRHPKVSLAARNKSHLPIFFNAIPPVEMSRCVPYISIQVVSQDFGTDSSKMANMNHIKYMRFTKDNNVWKTFFDDGEGGGSTGLESVKPVNNASTLSEIKDKRKDTTRYSFMDMFLSPQTMANADINREGSNFSKIGKNNKDPVLDPITPMMSLESLNINITGAGFGIMSSKKGSMSLTLHDRSRMRDIAPLISSTQFATTKIIIEYGWNHPEGGITSDNVIGKYLDGLKERSVFQVVGTNYSFGDGNSVKIDIDLAAYGYRENERIHAGAGPDVPLNFLEDYIKKATNDIVKRKNKDGEYAETEEVRQKVKLNSRNARSANSSISWENFDIISEFLSGKNADNVATLNLVKLALDPDSSGFGNLNNVKDNNELSKNQVKNMIGKLADIKEAADKNGDLLTGMNKYQNDVTFGLDPFARSFVSGVSEEIISEGNSIENAILYGGTVSLGKCISHFIGHPLAASCIYDEVQLVFYPLNHHAAGGRVHTTASFPIEFDKLNDAIDKQLEINPTITINSFFRLLEKIVRDRNNGAYRLADVLAVGQLTVEQIEAGGFPNAADVVEEEDQEALSFIKNLGVGAGNILNSEAARNERQAIEQEISDLNAQALDFQNSIKAQQSIIDNANREISALRSQKPEETITVDSLKATIEAEIAEKNKTKAAAQAEIGKIQLDPEFKGIQGNIARKQGELKVKNAPLKLYNELIRNEREKLAEIVKEGITTRCAELYQADGLQDQYPAEPKFTRPSLSMDFEVIDVIQNKETDASTTIGALYKTYKSVKESTNGLKDNKTILRVHIYDEEATIDPAKSTIYEAVSNEDVVMSDIKKVRNTLQRLTFNDIKQMMKRAYPTVIYGAAGSTVKTLSVSANTSGDLSQVLMVEAYERVQDGQVAGNSYESEYESIITLPNTVSMTMLGMPMIGRGNNIFIDFGTNTSLDNIYTVKTVSHALRQGDFTTTVQLVPTNFSSISSFKERMQKIIKVVEDRDGIVDREKGEEFLDIMGVVR